MGYQVTITRTDENTDDGLISREEWLNFAASDPELSIEDASEEFPAVAWKRGKYSAEFYWEDIGVWSQSPENITILKMIEIAGKMEAKVINEDGTTFTVGQNGELIEKSPDYTPPDMPAENKSWWKKIFG